MEFKVGDKVVPHAKSIYTGDELSKSSVWKRALETGQPCLFVTSIERDGRNELYLVLDTDESNSGDYFRPEDVTLYEEDVEIGLVRIDPHFCSREELQELTDYLEEKCWDYRIIQRGKQ